MIGGKGSKLAVQWRFSRRIEYSLWKSKARMKYPPHKDA
jgi:hypothetical protein